MAYSTKWEQEYARSIDECVKANELVAGEDSPRHWRTVRDDPVPDYHKPIIKGVEVNYTHKPK